MALLIGLVSPWAHAQKRVALVIGNSAYRNEATLRNPVNDAVLIEQTLKGAPLEFDTVAVVRNASRGELLHALARFRQQALGAHVAMVYYSGHGMINSRRQNHLLPVEMPRLAADASQDIDTTLKAYGVSEDEVIDAVEGARIQIVVLDACRDNGFDPTRKSMAKGLARRIDVARNRLLAYATEEGRTAEDGAGNNSTYAMSLARHLRRTDWPLLRVFDEVATEVERTTGQAQSPTRSGNLRTDVYLVGTPRIAEPDRPSARQIEDQMWKEAQAVNNASAYAAYLRIYPDGAYANLAKFKLEVLQGSTRTSSATVETPIARPQPVVREPAPSRPASSASAPVTVQAPVAAPQGSAVAAVNAERWRYTRANSISTKDVETAEVHVSKSDGDKLFLSNGEIVSRSGTVYQFGFGGRQIDVPLGLPLYRSTPGFAISGSRSVIVHSPDGAQATGQLTWTVAESVSASTPSAQSVLNITLYFSERLPSMNMGRVKLMWTAVYPIGSLLPLVLEANETASYFVYAYTIRYLPIAAAMPTGRATEPAMPIPAEAPRPTSTETLPPAVRSAADCQSVTVSSSTRHRCLEQRN